MQPLHMVRFHESTGHVGTGLYAALQLTSALAVPHAGDRRTRTRRYDLASATSMQAIGRLRPGSPSDPEFQWALFSQLIRPVSLSKAYPKPLQDRRFG
jgi:hypothetical protein